jgi:hypothetical protein
MTSKSLEHARTTELLVAGHRLMDAVFGGSYYATVSMIEAAHAYKAAEDALVATRYPVKKRGKR